MMDLENVLPAGVQVTAIEPQITKEGDVNIRLRVTGDRDRAVELVENLERSKRFLAPRLTSESLQANQGTGAAAQLQTIPGAVEFDILSGYNPLPALPKHAHTAGEKSAAKDADAAPKAAHTPGVAHGQRGGAR
jgi:type IV pilus assembly protein PilN